MDAEQLRDEAVEAVVANAGDWKQRATIIVNRIPAGEEVTGEDIRMMCIEQGIRPHHHNAWGGLISGFVNAGVLRWNGKIRPMKAARSHARSTKVYTVAA